jgi:hypothetical protein
MTSFGRGSSGGRSVGRGRVRTRLAAGGRWIRTIGTAKISYRFGDRPFGAPVAVPILRKGSPVRDRDEEFESSLSASYDNLSKPINELDPPLTQILEHAGASLLLRWGLSSPARGVSAILGLFRS